MTQKEIFAQLKGLPNNINTVAKRICGGMLASGLNRDVYELKFDSRYVVKIERDMSTSAFANATEWRNYINFSESPLGKYLCPCLLISETSQWLIMRRVDIHSDSSKYPTHLPKPLTDHKVQNYGFLGKRFVCVDYSFLLLEDETKMRKVKWWSLNDKRQ